jgi:adenosylhomocysteine nucleosidase
MQHPSRIGIVCAMQDEVDAFLGAAETIEADAEGFIRLRIRELDIVIGSPGLGKVHAAMTASVLLERFGCQALVSAGTAGGLHGTRPMQVIVGVELVQHDYGRSRGPGELELYRPGVPPLPEYFSEDIALRVPAERRRAFEQAAIDLDFVQHGTFASGDIFVNDEATRERLVRLGAVAVDMESAAVAQVAEARKLPWLVAKGISDDASGLSHEAFLAGLAEASRRSARVVTALLPVLLAQDRGSH